MAASFRSRPGLPIPSGLAIPTASLYGPPLFGGPLREKNPPRSEGIIHLFLSTCDPISMRAYQHATSPRSEAVGGAIATNMRPLRGREHKTLILWVMERPEGIGKPGLHRNDAAKNPCPLRLSNPYRAYQSFAIVKPISAVLESLQFARLGAGKLAANARPSAGFEGRESLPDRYCAAWQAAKTRRLECCWNHTWGNWVPIECFPENGGR